MLLSQWLEKVHSWTLTIVSKRSKFSQSHLCFKKTRTSGRVNPGLLLRVCKLLTGKSHSWLCTDGGQETHIEFSCSKCIQKRQLLWDWIRSPCNALGLWCHQKNWLAHNQDPISQSWAKSTHRAKWVVQLSWWHLHRAVGFVFLTSSPGPSAPRSPSLRLDTVTRPPKHGRDGWLQPHSLSLEYLSLLFLQ